MISARSLAPVLLAGSVSFGALSASAAPDDPQPGTEAPRPFSDPRVSPLMQRDYITEVVPIKATRSDGKHTNTRLTGALIKFRPAPGLTAEWLQHLVNEHRALMASGQTDASHLSHCPLAL